MRLMIGYGNPLRGDDGLGQYLAEKRGHGWEVLTPTQLTPEFAEPISRAGRVIFIDASIGNMPGEVSCEMVAPIPAAGAFTHNVTPSSLLAAARALYGTSPPALLISVAGASFEYDSDFSPTINALLPEIVMCVDSIIAAFSAADSSILTW
jgi:hydrogenase maturation protease